MMKGKVSSINRLSVCGISITLRITNQNVSSDRLRYPPQVVSF